MNKLWETMEGKDSHANGNSSAKFQDEMEKGRSCDPFEMSLVSSTGNLDGPFMLPLLPVPNASQSNSKASVVLIGTATRGGTVPAVGAVDIGVSKSAYFFQVALPGVKKDPGSAGVGFTPHIMTLKTGEDVPSKIMSFSQNGPRAVCILSANGAMPNVTLRQAATSGGTATYEGRFDVLSLCGSFLLTEVGGSAEPKWWVECHISWTRWTCFRWLCCRTSYCCNPCSGDYGQFHR